MLCHLPQVNCTGLVRSMSLQPPASKLTSTQLWHKYPRISSCTVCYMLLIKHKTAGKWQWDAIIIILENYLRSHDHRKIDTSLCSATVEFQEEIVKLIKFNTFNFVETETPICPIYYIVNMVKLSFIINHLSFFFFFFCSTCRLATVWSCWCQTPV